MPTSLNEGRGIDGVTWRLRRVVADPGCDVAVDNVGSGSGGWR
jgi:hypothetical protein